MFHPASGLPASAVEGVTLAIYRDEVGGAPLWQETQNASLDAEGRYTVMMGSTSNEGVPLDLFSSGESRWLGVLFNRAGEVEQARVRLASVPYALRASDAETLGGRPASAYLLAPTAETPGSERVGTADLSNRASDAKSGMISPRLTSGTAGFLAQFVNATDLGNSVVFQSGSNVGIETTNPETMFHILSPTSDSNFLVDVPSQAGGGTKFNPLVS